MHTIPVVVFGVDGVLVDSYESHFLSCQKLGVGHQLQMAFADFFHYFGRTRRGSGLELWYHHQSRKKQVVALDDKRKILYRDILEKYFPEMAGSCELIQVWQSQGSSFR